MDSYAHYPHKNKNLVFLKLKDQRTQERSYGFQFLDFDALVSFNQWLQIVVLIHFLCPLIDSFSGFYLYSKELKDPEEVNVVHPLDAQRGISVEDFRLIKLHMSNCMLWIGFSFIALLISRLNMNLIISMSWILFWFCGFNWI